MSLQNTESTVKNELLQRSELFPVAISAEDRAIALENKSTSPVSKSASYVVSVDRNKYGAYAQIGTFCVKEIPAMEDPFTLEIIPPSLERFVILELFNIVTQYEEKIIALVDKFIPDSKVRSYYEWLDAKDSPHKHPLSNGWRVVLNKDGYAMKNSDNKLLCSCDVIAGVKYFEKYIPKLRKDLVLEGNLDYRYKYLDPKNPNFVNSNLTPKRAFELLAQLNFAAPAVSTSAFADALDM